MISIPGGESAVLMLFARLRADPTRYFVFEPDTASPLGVRVPDPELMLKGDHEFDVRIDYANGRTLTFQVGVRTDYRGNVYLDLSSATGGGSTLF